MPTNSWPKCRYRDNILVAIQDRYCRCLPALRALVLRLVAVQEWGHRAVVEVDYFPAKELASLKLELFLVMLVPIGFVDGKFIDSE